MKRTEDKTLERSVSERICQLMDEHGLTEDDFVFDGVCGRSSIRAYIAMEQLPTLRTIYRIAEYLHVTVDYLCGYEDADSDADYVLNQQKDPREQFYEALDRINPVDSEAPWGTLQ